MSLDNSGFMSSQRLGLLDCSPSSQISKSRRRGFLLMRIRCNLRCSLHLIGCGWQEVSNTECADSWRVLCPCLHGIHPRRLKQIYSSNHPSQDSRYLRRSDDFTLSNTKTVIFKTTFVVESTGLNLQAKYWSSYAILLATCSCLAAKG